MPKLLDIEQLKHAVETTAEPFDFYLYLTVSNNGHIDQTNPFYNDIDFLKTLLHHYEATENFDLCIEFRRRIKDLV